MTDLSAPAPRPTRGAPLPVRLSPPDFSVPGGVRSGEGTRRATAALVLGICALVLNVLFVPTILAIVLGAVALAKGTPAKARSIVGIVLGAVGILTSGVLAAIAIPVLVALQADAGGAATKAALANDKAALISYAVDAGGVLPDRVDPVALAEHGWDDSSGAQVAYGVRHAKGADTFCLVATTRTGASWVTTSHTGVTAGRACPSGAW